MLKKLFSAVLMVFILVLQVPFDEWVKLIPEEQDKLKILALQRYANINELTLGTIFSFREEITVKDGKKYFELHVEPKEQSWRRKEQGC